ncbi:MAG: protein-disulfide reductase DsbD [Gammaproteobacteria bacterium]|jgi:thiol:disulfide interchange protein DsbD|nr:protein-disulfide reductase DsbD [Gammaproteobacteria bacterium]
MSPNRYSSGAARAALLTLAAFAGLLAAAYAPPAAALSPEDLLRPEQAFRYQVEDTGEALLVRWNVEPGYYLYRQKLGIETDTAEILLGDPVLPDGEIHEDEYFGRQEIYRDDFTMRVPYVNEGAGRAAVTLLSQGCADIGLCYPPQRWNAEVTLAAAPPADSPFGSGRPSGGLAGMGESEFLPPDVAFRPVVTALDAYTVELAWQIEPGYYLYRDKLSAAAVSDGVQLGGLQTPAGKKKFDEYFGETEVYYDEVIARVPLNRAGREGRSLVLELGFQGCAEDGICYPPLTREVNVSLPPASAADTPRPPEEAAPAVPVSEQDRLATLIGEGNLFAVLATFFGAGLLLALTPCVLPMIPILSGIIAGEGKDVTPARGFTLSLSYVLGMALTYTVAGALFAAAGQQAQTIFQQTWILVTFAGLFVVLAAGMFGLFDLQMPSSVQTRLAALSGKQKSGTMVGAFVMGALSSLIVTACVAPPLVAALAVIGQTGDVVRGASALFALSLGMGAPLLAVGASAGKLMVKAGPWMVAVKNAFGFVMLGLAIWMLDRVLPGAVTLALWAVLIFMAGVFLGALTPLTPESGGAQKLGKGFGVLAMFYGAVLLLGALAGGEDPLQPLAGTRVAAVGGGGVAEAHEELEFRRIKTVADLEQAVAQAASRGQPVMLDFYADWCVSCKEMEKYTFSDPGVQAELEDVVLLQADVTANDAEDQALLQHFRIFGPPSIIFFGPDGQERRPYQVVGFMPADEFAAHAARAIAASPAAVTAQAD